MKDNLIRKKDFSVWFKLFCIRIRENESLSKKASAVLTFSFQSLLPRAFCFLLQLKCHIKVKIIVIFMRQHRIHVERHLQTSTRWEVLVGKHDGSVIAKTTPGQPYVPPRRVKYDEPSLATSFFVHAARSIRMRVDTTHTGSGFAQTYPVYGDINSFACPCFDAKAAIDNFGATTSVESKVPGVDDHPIRYAPPYSIADSITPLFAALQRWNELVASLELVFLKTKVNERMSRLNFWENEYLKK